MSSQLLPALQFSPVFRDYIWGGRRLGDVLDKPIGDGPHFAESWEVVDHGDDQSIVADGEFRGHSLSQLVKQHGPQLLGQTWFERITDDSLPEHLRFRFPLLIKWLDANRDLSIQVHPNDRLGAKLDPPDLGKTEAWYIADALPGSKVYAGLKDGVGRDEFEVALQANRVLEVMHSFEPRRGDCLFIPAGTVHALGAGLLVAEVQQASNTTYRLYDWDRLGADGQPRPLHIPQGIEATDYSAGPVSPQKPASSDLTEATWESLVRCPYFWIDRAEFRGSVSLPGEQCRMLMLLEGEAELTSADGRRPLKKGQTVLIPHCQSTAHLNSDSGAQVLLARLPVSA